MKFQHIFSWAVLLGTGSCHTIFTSLVTGGVGVGVRVPTYDGPITNVASNDIACNGGPNPTKSTTQILDVAAGSTVKAIWRHTLTSSGSDVVDPSHKGPVMAYMKKVTNAATDPGYGAGWFKIQEAGLSASQGQQSITIPACIAPGQYLLRAEVIALHGAGSSGGAQFYMECAQINVTGGTAAKTPATVSLPGAYKANDPGILVSIYGNLKSYVIPGPAVFTC
ncbi:glycosyl hydrolase family 61-domain-containing protein [Leptodontidium sp. 2 PMI_412]|nr:glycosyl hydrolase family 61-domain-containing protein [Leptodontidium sp. 2 PMI_412]